jgi:hypothetical protein
MLCALNTGTLNLVLAERYDFVERCSNGAAPSDYLLPVFYSGRAAKRSFSKGRTVGDCVACPARTLSASVVSLDALDTIGIWRSRLR